MVALTCHLSKAFFPSTTTEAKNKRAMKNFINHPGFLGTHASFISDLALILILLSAIFFTIGWQLALRKRFKAHRWVQTASASVNAIVVLSVMINSFALHILPGIPG